MKNLLFVAIIYYTTISLGFAKVNSAALSGWYYACKDAGYTHSYCRCNVETMDQKLSNRQFEKIFVHELIDGFHDFIMQGVFDDSVHSLVSPVTTLSTSSQCELNEICGFAGKYKDGSKLAQAM